MGGRPLFVRGSFPVRWQAKEIELELPLEPILPLKGPTGSDGAGSECRVAVHNPLIWLVKSPRNRRGSSSKERECDGVNVDSRSANIAMIWRKVSHSPARCTSQFVCFDPSNKRSNHRVTSTEGQCNTIYSL